jgi:hypothetical protein
MTHCRHGLRRTAAWHPRLSLTTKDVDDLDMRGLDFGRVQLGSGLIDYNQKMTMAAMQIADMNV